MAGSWGTDKKNARRTQGAAQTQRPAAFRWLPPSGKAESSWQMSKAMIELGRQRQSWEGNHLPPACALGLCLSLPFQGEGSERSNSSLPWIACCPFFLLRSLTESCGELVMLLPRFLRPLCCGKQTCCVKQEHPHSGGKVNWAAEDVLISLRVKADSFPCHRPTVTNIGPTAFLH